jgi:hypothetical protein
VGIEAVMMDPKELDTRTLVLLLAGQLREHVRSHPLATLAGAATVGYMLGWSLPTPLYRTVVSVALRSIAMQVAGSLFGSHDDEIDLEDDFEEGLDLAGGPGDPIQVDVPPYVA